VLGETQTLHADCRVRQSQKNFTLSQTLPRGMGRPKFNQLERQSLPLPTNPVWWGSMHAISSYRGNRPTNKQTQPQTHPQTWQITIHCADKLSVQCNYSWRGYQYFSVSTVTNTFSDSFQYCALELVHKPAYLQTWWRYIKCICGNCLLVCLLVQSDNSKSVTVYATVYSK